MNRNRTNLVESIHVSSSKEAGRAVPRLVLGDGGKRRVEAVDVESCDDAKRSRKAIRSRIRRKIDWKMNVPASQASHRRIFVAAFPFQQTSQS